MSFPRGAPVPGSMSLLGGVPHQLLTEAWGYTHQVPMGSIPSGPDRAEWVLMVEGIPARSRWGTPSHNRMRLSPRSDLDGGYHTTRTGWQYTFSADQSFLEMTTETTVKHDPHNWGFSINHHFLQN